MDRGHKVGQALRKLGNTSSVNARGVLGVHASIYPNDPSTYVQVDTYGKSLFAGWLLATVVLPVSGCCAGSNSLTRATILKGGRFCFNVFMTAGAP